MIKKLLIFFSSFILTVIAIEIGLRIHNVYFQKPDSNSAEQYICKYDSLLGWRGKSNFFAPGKISGVNYTLVLNSKGFRDKEHTFEKPVSKKRILILGDSFTFGFNVKFEDTFPRVLETTLGPNYEVLSLAVPGYSTDQEFLLFYNEGLKYEPDIVILALFLDDIFNNGNIATHNGKYPKPYFELNKDQLILKNTPVPFLKHPLSLIEFTGERLYRLKTKTHMPNKYNNGDWKTYVLTTNNPNTENWLITKMLLQACKKQGQNRNIKFILSIIPLKEQIPDKNNTPQELLLAISKDINIPVVDFLPLLTENDYYSHELHWNKNGHKKAEEAIYKFLIENNFINQTQNEEKNRKFL